ncbi:11126_t:CDS:2, partial [Funneliformis caledonium]
GQGQVSLQKISDTASGISSPGKLVSTKNGQGLIQEISRNFDESATPSSIQENDFTCALSLNPPEISFISGEGKKGWLSRRSVATLHKATSTERVVDLLNDAENKGPEAQGQIIIF